MAPRIVPPALEATATVQKPLKRLRAADARLAAAQAEHARVRREVVLELIAAGLSYAQIGGYLGVTKSRAFQIARGE